MKEISDMDWGAVTPELFNMEKNSAVHIFNHCLLDEDNINRAIKFTIGRIQWYKAFLPHILKTAYNNKFIDKG